MRSSVVMIEDNIFSILISFSESIASIVFIDSKNQNQSFCLVATAHSDNSIPIPPDTQHHLFWCQSGLCDCLWYLFSLRSRFFFNIILSIFHRSLSIIANAGGAVSEMAQFYFVSATMILQIKIRFY